jgi:hypothetical protein
MRRGGALREHGGSPGGFQRRREILAGATVCRDLQKRTRERKNWLLGLSTAVAGPFIDDGKRWRSSWRDEDQAVHLATVVAPPSCLRLEEDDGRTGMQAGCRWAGYWAVLRDCVQVSASSIFFSLQFLILFFSILFVVFLI